MARAKSGLAPFEPVPGLSAVHEARGKTLGAFAVRLKPGGVCVFSPVAGLTDAVKESLLALGGVTVLFAPNHYHNMAMREYAAAFPAARLLAPAAAIPRLKKVTRLSFTAADVLADELPRGVALLEPEGLKTGEAWLRVREKKTTAWIVVDAFCGPSPGAGGPGLLKTFPKFGVGDRDRYVAWVERQIRRDKPTSLLTCHGRSVHDAALPEKLIDLVANRL